jgi:isoleucyl-tRNA synthetase
LCQVVIVAPDLEVYVLLLGATDLIADELNVKAVTFLDHERDLVTRRAKANFKTLGKRLGKEMKEAAAVIAELGDGDLDRWQADGILPLRLPSGTLVELGPEDILVERQERPGLCAATGAGITVGLDTTLDQALAAEGFAREFISRIQNYRKECGLDVADRIEVVYSVPPAWAAAIATHHDHICTETLATALDSGDPGPDALGAEVAGEPCRIAIRRNVEPVKHA